MKDAETIARVRDTMLCMQRHSWEQGVCAQAMLELKEDAMVVLFAHDAVVRQLEDGRLGVVGGDTSVVDAAANGEAVLAAARLTGDKRYLEAAERMVSWLLKPENRNPDGVIYHRTDAKQVWVDSIYMAPPFLAAAGRHAEAVAQVEGMRRLLWDSEAGMFSHIWDDGLRSFARKAFWGVGNGWAVAGMIRVADSLPDEFLSQRKRLLGYARDTIAACLRHRRGDGLFHDVLDDPGSFVETNAAQMFAYGIFRLAAMGEIDLSYIEQAQEMREAARAKVDRWGLVQGVCGAPRFDSPGTAPEGQAFHLLMEAAARRFD